MNDVDPRQRVMVWGTGNMGAATIRSVLGFPGLDLNGVLTSSPDKVGVDAALLAGLAQPCGVVASEDFDATTAGASAVAYMASGDLRPDEAAADIERCLLAGLNVVTPSLFALYDPTSAPSDLVDRLRAACRKGGSSLLVTGIDPGWANDAMALIAAGLCTNVRQVRCAEIFDYSGYDQPYAVRVLCGFGQSMDDVPMLLLEGIPTSVWGGNIRLMARRLGLTLDSIDERYERRALDATVTNSMGEFEAGTQGAFRLEIMGMVDGVARVVIEHVTRIDPSCAPDWPTSDGDGEHRITVLGDPELTLTVHANAPDGGRADGGNTTAVNRLLGAIWWLSSVDPGIYDGADVPMSPVDTLPKQFAAERWSV